MQTAQHFYITTLPALGHLGTVPPIGLSDLVDHVADLERWRQQVEAVVMLDDLYQREAFLAGETKEVEPAVLSLPQVRGDAPLPEWLMQGVEDESSSVMGIDVLWGNYFRFVHQLGRTRRSSFLVNWVQFEVSLRNALATTRARRLGLDDTIYLVARELGDSREDLSAVISEWEAAATPLAGLCAVIRARWAWLDRHDAWFSFSVDELLAYAVRLELLEQWRRATKDEESAA